MFLHFFITEFKKKYYIEYIVGQNIEKKKKVLIVIIFLYSDIW